MRIAVVQRGAHAHEVLRAPDGVASHPWSSFLQTLAPRFRVKSTDVVYGVVV